MLHCHGDEDDGRGWRLTSNGGWQVDTSGCERTRLTDEGVPAANSVHAVIENGGMAEGYAVTGYSRTSEFPETTTGNGAVRTTFDAGNTYQSVSFKGARSDFRAFAGGRLTVDVKVEGGDARLVGIAFLTLDHENCGLSFQLNGVGVCFEGVDFDRDHWDGDEWKTVRLDVEGTDRLEQVRAALYMDATGIGDEDVTVSVRDARWTRGGNINNLPPRQGHPPRRKPGVVWGGPASQ